MSDPPSAHRFDDSRARPFRPRNDFAKTAILVTPADPLASTVIATPFGEQRFTGPFYVVAEGADSYGAARAEFENSHTAVGRNRWVKGAPVLAYRTAHPCVVETLIQERVETSVTAREGDWIVRQQSGELMVLGEHEFAERYIAEEPVDDVAP